MWNMWLLNVGYSFCGHPDSLQNMSEPYTETYTLTADDLDENAVPIIKALVQNKDNKQVINSMIDKEHNAKQEAADNLSWKLFN